jgi:hypothetical protein
MKVNPHTSPLLYDVVLFCWDLFSYRANLVRFHPSRNRIIIINFTLLIYQSPSPFTGHMVPLTLPTQQQHLDSYIVDRPESNIRQYRANVGNIPVGIHEKASVCLGGKLSFHICFSDVKVIFKVS